MYICIDNLSNGMNLMMKMIFNIVRNIFAVIGLVLSIALAIVLCSDEYDAIRAKGNQEPSSHIETLKLSVQHQ